MCRDQSAACHELIAGLAATGEHWLWRPWCRLSMVVTGSFTTNGGEFTGSEAIWSSGRGIIEWG